MENEYYYKHELEKAIDKVVAEIAEDNASNLGWVPENMVRNMTEAAWLILKQSKESGEFTKQMEEENP